VHSKAVMGVLVGVGDRDRYDWTSSLSFCAFGAAVALR